MKIPLRIRVNGVSHELEVAPHRTLLEVIREELGLMGTKEGCGTGKCGACTVLLDGRPVNSCILLALQAADREVLTIEGLAQGEPHRLQTAFVEKGAVQCGFCTPGMILTAKALLEADPDPGPEKIRAALSGNLCRCTGYDKIVEAVESCGAEEADHV